MYATKDPDIAPEKIGNINDSLMLSCPNKLLNEKGLFENKKLLKCIVFNHAGTIIPVFQPFPQFSDVFVRYPIPDPRFNESVLRSIRIIPNTRPLWTSYHRLSETGSIIDSGK